MKRLPLTFLFVASCITCCADEPVLSEEQDITNRVAKLVVGGWRRDVAVATAKVVESDLPKIVREKLEANEAEFTNNFDWQRVESYVADEYASRYDRDELDDIFKFYSSATGRKFLTAQSGVKARVMRQVALAKYELPLLQKTKANVARLIESLADPEKRILQNALRSAQIPPKRLAGTWYADDLDEKGNGYRGKHEKKESGFNISQGVEISHDNKEYMVFDDEGVWLVQGKLLAETNFDYTEDSRVFIIESVTGNELKYRFVDPDSKSAEWPSMIDTRTPIKFPEKPAGYKDPLK